MDLDDEDYHLSAGEEDPRTHWDEAIADISGERERWRKRALQAEADAAYWRGEADTNEQTALELMTDLEKANQTLPMALDTFSPLRPSTLNRERMAGEDFDDWQLRKEL